MASGAATARRNRLYTVVLRRACTTAPMARPAATPAITPSTTRARQRWRSSFHAQRRVAVTARSLAEIASVRGGARAGVEPGRGRAVGPLDELAGPTEVVVLHVSGVDGREDDQLAPGRRRLRLGLEPVVPRDGEALEQGVQRALRRAAGALEVADVQHVDAGGAELDGLGDRDVVDDGAVDEQFAVDLD